MLAKKGYPYIDYFRIVAAILVIAIHIYPFMGINETADFFVTRVIGRVAVPFFFMIMGFFFFQKTPSKQHLLVTIKHLVVIYLIAILLYIPITIYNGYFHDITIIKLIQDILINGTVYHLWYLPASMLGIVISYLLYTYMTTKGMLAICILLYVIGIGGDAYYGLVSKLPFLECIYEGIFIISSYTRNGLFMAPIFICLGAVVPKLQMYKKEAIVNCIFSFSLLAVEAYVLYINKIPRHDSMYLLLPVVALSLFSYLVKYRGERCLICKDISLSAYIVHPFVIVIVRTFSKMVHMQRLLFDNTLIQFIVVTSITFSISYGIIKIKKGNEYHENTHG